MSQQQTSINLQEQLKAMGSVASCARVSEGSRRFRQTEILF